MTSSETKPKTRRLYDQVSQVYKLPDYEKFESAMADPEKRVKLYNAIGRVYKLPKFDQFDKVIADDLRGTGVETVSAYDEKEITPTGQDLEQNQVDSDQNVVQEPDLTGRELEQFPPIDTIPAPEQQEQAPVDPMSIDSLGMAQAQASTTGVAQQQNLQPEEFGQPDKPQIEKNLEGLQEAVFGKHEDALSRVSKAKADEISSGVQKEFQDEYSKWQSERFKELEKEGKALESQEQVDLLNKQWEEEQAAKQEELKAKYDPIISERIEKELQPIEEYYKGLATKEFKELAGKEIGFKTKKSDQGIISSAVSGLTRAIYQLPGDVLKGIGIASGLGEVNKDNLPSVLYHLGDEYNKAIEELTPINPEDRESLAVQFSSALGQAASLIMTEGASSLGKMSTADDILNSGYKFLKGATELSKAPVKATIRQFGSQMVRPSAVAGGVQMGTYEFDDAIRGGATEDQAFELFLKNAAVGSVLERIPVMQFFNRFDKATAGSLKKMLLERGKQAFKGGMEEGITEAMQGMYANATAKETYDTTRKIFEGVTGEGGIGFGVGFLLNALGANVRMAKQRLGDSPEIQQAEQYIKEQTNNTDGELQTVDVGDSRQPETGSPAIREDRKRSEGDVSTNQAEVGQEEIAEQPAPESEQQDEGDLTEQEAGDIPTNEESVQQTDIQEDGPTEDDLAGTSGVTETSEKEDFRSTLTHLVSPPNKGRAEMVIGKEEAVEVVPSAFTYTTRGTNKKTYDVNVRVLKSKNGSRYVAEDSDGEILAGAWVDNNNQLTGIITDRGFENVGIGTNLYKTILSKNPKVTPSGIASKQGQRLIERVNNEPTEPASDVPQASLPEVAVEEQAAPQPDREADTTTGGETAGGVQASGASDLNQETDLSEGAKTILDNTIEEYEKASADKKENMLSYVEEVAKNKSSIEGVTFSEDKIQAAKAFLKKVNQEQNEAKPQQTAEVEEIQAESNQQDAGSGVREVPAGETTATESVPVQSSVEPPLDIASKITSIYGWSAEQGKEGIILKNEANEHAATVTQKKSGQYEMLAPNGDSILLFTGKLKNAIEDLLTEDFDAKPIRWKNKKQNTSSTSQAPESSSAPETISFEFAGQVRTGTILETKEKNGVTEYKVEAAGRTYRVKPDQIVSPEEAAKENERISAVRAERQKILNDLKKKSGEKLTSGVDPDLLVDYAKLARTYIEEGYIRVEDFVKKFTEDLKSIFGEGNVTKQQARDIYDRAVQDAGARINEDGDIIEPGSLSLPDAVKKNRKSNLKEKLSEEGAKYTPIKNDLTVKEAKRIIEKYGIEAAESAMKDTTNGIHPALRSAIGYEIMDHYATEENFDREIETADWIAEFRTSIAQGLQAGNIFQKRSSGSIIYEIQKMLKKNKIELTDQQKERIDTLVKRMKKSPEGKLRANATQDVFTYINKLKGFDWKDIGLSVWYANMLSGPSTQILNASANFTETVGETFVSVLQTAVETKSPSALVYLLQGLQKGYQKGLLEARIIAKTGRVTERTAKTEISRKVEANPLEQIKNEKGFLGFISNWRYVSRIMQAVDAYFYSGLKEMRYRQLALREAWKSGMDQPTQAKIDRAVESLNDGKSKYLEALEQAQKEIDEQVEEIQNDTEFTPAEKKKKINELKQTVEQRAFEIVEQKRDDFWHEDAMDFASRGTFNFDPEGVMGAVTASINHAINKVPFLKAFVPFTRIIANVANRYLDWTPYGFTRAAKGGIGSNRFGMDNFRKFTPEERTREIIKATTGTLAMVALYGMTDDDEGWLEVTGAGTGDYRDDYELQKSGWQPYSFRLKEGGPWVSYKNTPPAIALSLIGNLRDAKKYRDKDAYSSFEDAFFKSVTFLKDLSFMTSLVDFFQIFSQDMSGRELGDKFMAAVERPIKSAVMPNLISQVSRAIQESFEVPLKSAPTLASRMYRDLPIARDGLSDMYNVLGEPVVADQISRFIPFEVRMPEEQLDPVWKLIIENQAWIGTPRKGIVYDAEKQQDREMADEEFEQYKIRAGRLTKQYLLEDLAYLTSLESKAEVRDEVARIKRRAREDAKFELFY